jgi:hypothetical protein
MKYAFGIGSLAMIYIPGSMKIGFRHSKMNREEFADTDSMDIA